MPILEALEPIELLTSANVASFANALVTQPNNPKHAYALPGMQVQARVDIASLGFQYVGIKQVKYTYSGLGTNSVYTTELGDPKEQSGATITYANYGPTSYTHTYYAPKDLGQHTISIEVTARRFSFMIGQQVAIDDTFTDTLQLTVEAPEINTFYVDGRVARFDTMDHQTNNGTDAIGVMTRQVNNGSGFNFIATVTNNTHYDAWVGYVQGFKPNRSLTFQSRTPAVFQRSQFMWDAATDFNATKLWYYNQVGYGYWHVEANSGPVILDGPSPDNIFPNDSPAQGGYPSDAQGNRLRAVSMNDAFETHLSVWGGNRPGLPTSQFDSVPIGLSTARWQVGGSGTTTETIPERILNPAYWNKTGLTPTQADAYLGDGVIKYLRWVGNGPKALSQFIDGAGRGGVASSGNDSRVDVSMPSRILTAPILLEPWIGKPFELMPPFDDHKTERQKNQRVKK